LSVCSADFQCHTDLLIAPFAANSRHPAEGSSRSITDGLWPVPADEEYLLFVAGRKRLDLEAGKQSLDLPIRQFSAFDPGS
jgi:hypothetical protein